MVLCHKLLLKSYNSTQKRGSFDETGIQTYIKQKMHLKPSSLGIQLRIKRMILGPAKP